MLIAKCLPFIRDYVDGLNSVLKETLDSQGLSRLQAYWLSFVILGVLVTNTVCWKRFDRYSLGSYSESAMGWMFRKAKIGWDMLLRASVLRIVAAYGITSGVLVVDDTDNERSKNTSQIAKVHKIRDKKRAGFFNGQTIVFLVLVSDALTIPVGFEFYEPDPKQKVWRKEEKRLIEKGVAKRYRPKQPPSDPAYPNKKELG
ncbi:MAG: hypothetical protein MPJ78_20540 [Hyphomicrobiaceae bacterium]|nr:hypothetical protein [Hyphomicrobiaceae bacterium]